MTNYMKLFCHFTEEKYKMSDKLSSTKRLSMMNEYLEWGEIRNE